MRNTEGTHADSCFGRGNVDGAFLHLHDKTLSAFQGIHVKAIAIVLVVCPVLVIVEIEIITRMANHHLCPAAVPVTELLAAAVVEVLAAASGHLSDTFLSCNPKWY